MYTELNVGFAGCGRATETLHLPAIARVPGLRAVAALDVDPDRIAAVRRVEPSLRAHSTLDGLVADPGVDIVAVCVPPALHAGAAIAALGAGKHVYLEKPVAATWDDAMAIRAAAERASGSLTMGFNLRSHRLVQQAAQVVASGVLGPVEVMRTVWTSGFHRGGAWPRWRDERATGGGALFEIAVHHLDLCRHLLGEDIERLSVEAASREVADQTVVIGGRTPSGALVSIVAGQRSADANEIEVYGRDGVLRFSLYRADSLELRRSSDLAGGPTARLRQRVAAARGLPAALAVARRGGDFRLSYAAHWQATAQAVRGLAPPPATLDDGCRALAAALAAVRSADRGAPVALEPIG
jgi:predicted dehydrogenase